MQVREAPVPVAGFREHTPDITGWKKTKQLSPAGTLNLTV